jgi:hypothetical protein
MPDHPERRSNLYCYVDESGQDTEGWLFIVAAVFAKRVTNSSARPMQQLE